MNLDPSKEYLTYGGRVVRVFPDPHRERSFIVAHPHTAPYLVDNSGCSHECNDCRDIKEEYKPPVSREVTVVLLNGVPSGHRVHCNIETEKDGAWNMPVLARKRFTITEGEFE